MDAVILLHPDAGLPADEGLRAVAERVRTMSGVFVQVLAAEGGESVMGSSEDDLTVVATEDVFAEVPDLAEGLADMGIDRVVLIASDSALLLENAAAAVVNQFDVIAVTDFLSQGPSEDLEELGAVSRALSELWLRL